jgi:hypothetical protein
MENRFLRPLLIVEFLIALEAIFTVWSEVGGQYHLDLMFWPWKLGIGVASAWLVVAITASLARNEGRITRRAVLLCSLLILIFVTAGMVTYYYHLHEPADQDEDDDDVPAKISRLVWPAALPGAAGFSVTDHRQPFFAAECLLELGHVRHRSIHAEVRDGVRIGLGLETLHFRGGVFTPDLAEPKEELLAFVESAELGQSLAGQVVHERDPRQTDAAVVGRILAQRQFAVHVNATL